MAHDCQPSFNQQMVIQIRAAMLANPLGQKVTIAGDTVEYAEALRRLQQFEARVARENGTRKRITGINLRAGTL